MPDPDLSVQLYQEVLDARNLPIGELEARHRQNIVKRKRVALEQSIRNSLDEHSILRLTQQLNRRVQVRSDSGISKI